VLKYLLTPRTKGFVASVQGLGDHFNAVYDFTIAYQGKVPSLWDVTLGRVSPVYIHVRRFERRELPSDEQGLTKWVIQLFLEKDNLIKTFHETGTFKINHPNEGTLG
jgi:hypothetical protein